MNCKFCFSAASKVHLCPNMFCYEYIFKQFFINIVLDFNPNKDEIYNLSINRIGSYKMFNFVPNHYDIMKESLTIFLEEYDW